MVYHLRGSPIPKRKPNRKFEILGIKIRVSLFTVSQSVAAIGKRFWDDIEPDVGHYDRVREMLRTAVYVTITFNTATPRYAIEGDNVSAWLGLRVLWSYFCAGNVPTSWELFVKACKARLASMPSLETALWAVQEHVRQMRASASIVLLVDEVIKAAPDDDPKLDEIVSRLATNLGKHDRIKPTPYFFFCLFFKF